MDESQVMGMSSSEVWALLGMPASTLNYWVQLGLVKPTLRRPQGKRAEQWWTVEDIVIVRTVLTLRRAGVPMQRIRRIAKELGRFQETLASVQIWWDGSDVVIRDRAGNQRSAARRPGQGMLSLIDLPFKSWHAEVTRAAAPVDIAKLRRQSRKLAKDQRSRADAIESLARPLQRGSR